VPIFAIAQDLLRIGVGATLLMGLGTTLTVAAAATVAVAVAGHHWLPGWKPRRRELERSRYGGVGVTAPAGIIRRTMLAGCTERERLWMFTG
jgi:nickel/cobalt exporter